MAPKITRNLPRRPRPAQEPPGSLQGPPRIPPGIHFGIILHPRGVIFEPFSVSCSKFARMVLPHVPCNFVCLLILFRRHPRVENARCTVWSCALCSALRLPSASGSAPSARWPVLGRAKQAKQSQHTTQARPAKEAKPNRATRLLSCALAAPRFPSPC